MDKSILSKILKSCIILLVCIGSYFVIRYTFSIMIPAICVFLLTSFMEPGVKFLQEKAKFPRPFASIVILLILLFLMVGILFLVVTEIYEGVTYLADILPGQFQHFGAIVEYYFQSNIVPLYEQIFRFFNELSPSDQLFIQEYFSNLFQDIGSLVGAFFQQLLLALPRNLAVIPEALTVTFFILFASFLLSADFPRVKTFVAERFPTRWNKGLQHLTYYVKRSTFGYVKAQIILVTISFHIIFFGLLLIGVEHALTIALLMIIVELIPFVGTGLLFIPWIGYSFLSENYSLTIGLAVMYGIVIIVRQLIEPKIYSMNLAIHPLVWLMAAFIGLKVFGITGLILAPIFIVLFKGMYDSGFFRWLINYVNGDI
ncbi:sporulation integral membrane protein YtvI [Oceanobacillus alkalisoli]|uniref:sporulation integral membrane protein YtvI n=1 Tax=Oceanobacillus alkalisoli TaxID=2925113 RepID=UPI001F11E434|nr:sporulation integral membrane protein YtvI [Oceanobacillus alkalisoli]MCF3943359.1 sporulation integral membrane protein YtvI [Oceanobacillus alkalisoli]